MYLENNTELNLQKEHAYSGERVGKNKSQCAVVGVRICRPEFESRSGQWKDVTPPLCSKVEGYIIYYRLEGQCEGDEHRDQAQYRVHPQMYLYRTL